MEVFVFYANCPAARLGVDDPVSKQAAAPNHLAALPFAQNVLPFVFLQKFHVEKLTSLSRPQLKFLRERGVPQKKSTKDRPPCF